jgi:hypothetical protein
MVITGGTCGWLSVVSLWRAISYVLSIFKPLDSNIIKLTFLNRKINVLEYSRYVGSFGLEPLTAVTLKSAYSPLGSNFEYFGEGPTFQGNMSSKSSGINCKPSIKPVKSFGTRGLNHLSLRPGFASFMLSLQFGSEYGGEMSLRSFGVS